MLEGNGTRYSMLPLTLCIASTYVQGKGVCGLRGIGALGYAKNNELR